jgi:hypothetical protein
MSRKTSLILAVLAAVVLAAVAASSTAAAQQSSVVTYHGDAGRVGNFTVPGLTLDKARGLHRDAGFEAQVAGHLYAQPLYWRDPAGAAMLVAATEDDVVQAFDAASGKELWRRTLGRPVAGSALPCGNINPLGITGTPAIDPATGAIYVDAMVGGDKGPRHLVFGLSLKDGSILPGWPVDIADALQSKGKTFNPRDQNQRSALTILHGTLYVAFSGHYGDCGDYHGWIVGLPLNGPGNVMSFETRARGGGIWAPGGLAAVGDELFFATGNTFGAHTWSDGEAVFRVGPDLHRSGNGRDFFTPRDWQAMDQRDEDLGGTNPIPLDVPAAGGTQALILALGKDRKAYLLDRNNLGGIGGQLVADTVSEIPIRTAPAAFPVGNAVYVAFQGAGTHCPGGGRDNGLTVLKITGGSAPAMTTAWCGALRGAGSAIVTTTDGRANPIVWIVGAEGDNRLHGFKGDTGEPVFAGGSSADAMSGLRHFGTLIAAADRLFVGADDRIYAFSFQ